MQGSRGQSDSEKLLLILVIIAITLISIGLAHNYFYAFFCPQGSTVCVESMGGFFNFISWAAAIIVVGGIADVILYILGLSPGSIVIAIVKGFFWMLGQIFSGGRRR